jgi:hypothetical protein
MLKSPSSFVAVFVAVGVSGPRCGFASGASRWCPSTVCVGKQGRGMLMSPFFSIAVLVAIEVLLAKVGYVRRCCCTMLSF